MKCIVILGMIIMAISLALVLWGLNILGGNLAEGLVWIGAGFMLGGFGGGATVTLPFIGVFAGIVGVIILILGLIGLVI